MDRRRYLGTLSAGSLLAAMAGCLGDGDSTDDSEDGNESNDTADGSDGTDDGQETLDIPAWAEWVNAGTITLQDQVWSLDVNRMRDEFPTEVYNVFAFSELPDIYGIAETDISHLVRIERGQQTVVEIVAGQFDTDSIFDTLGVEESELEEYGDYFVQETPSAGPVAIGESAIIVGNVRDAIDAKSAEVTSLGENSENWNQIITDADTGTVSVLTKGHLASFPPDFDVLHTAITTDAAPDEGARSTGYYLFESAEQAEAVLEEYREAIVRDVKGGAQGTVQSVETDGRRIVAIIDLDEYPF
jgi:hypothetical protein